jgi:hypothetical protein
MREIRVRAIRGRCATLRRHGVVIVVETPTEPVVS